MCWPHNCSKCCIIIQKLIKLREKHFCFGARGSSSSLPFPPILHPNDQSPSLFSSSSSSASLASSLPCTQGYSLGDSRSYLSAPQPPWINASHHCYDVQKRMLIAAIASKRLDSSVSISVFLLTYLSFSSSNTLLCFYLQVFVWFRFHLDPSWCVCPGSVGL